VLPLPIQVRNTESKFIFLLPEREYLLMDTAKQYFARLRADELTNCKSISSRHRVCKQTQPLRLTHLDDECEAQMLQAVKYNTVYLFAKNSRTKSIWNKWITMSGYMMPRNPKY
jgi:hypothetical protein